MNKMKICVKFDISLDLTEDLGMSE